MNDENVERVLAAVERIPRGRVVSYGDLAELTGVGPRQVGWVMRHYGSSVPWWRVTNHQGEFPEALLSEARPHWRRERIVVKPNGRGCRIAEYRADLDALATAWAIATGR